MEGNNTPINQDNIQQTINLLFNMPIQIITHEVINTHEASFQEQKPKIIPLNKLYKKTLKEQDLSSDELVNDISCSICQETILKGEKIIKLECNDACH
jgi:hypothetical protein